MLQSGNVGWTAVNSSDAEPVTIVVDDAHSVSALLLVPPRARACYLFAHGAGAGMTHPFMAAVALYILSLNGFEIWEMLGDVPAWYPMFNAALLTALVL